MGHAWLFLLPAWRVLRPFNRCVTLPFPLNSPRSRSLKDENQVFKVILVLRGQGSFRSPFPRLDVCASLLEKHGTESGEGAKRRARPLTKTRRAIHHQSRIPLVVLLCGLAFVDPEMEYARRDPPAAVATEERSREGAEQPLDRALTLYPRQISSFSPLFPIFDLCSKRTSP